MSKITKVRQVVNEMFGEKTCNYWVKLNNYIFLDKLSNGCRSLKVESWEEKDYFRNVMISWLKWDVKFV